MTLVTAMSPAAVVLDVNETLFSLDALAPAFDEIGVGRAAIPLWFARTLRDGFALCASGDFRTFPDVATTALISLDPLRLTPDHASEVLAAFATLRAHSDVAEGLAILADADIPMCTLSQGNADNVRRLFDGADLSQYVTDHYSVQAVQRWKPAVEPYHYVCEQLGRQAAEVTMVAVHSWDLHGAHRAGMRTAWISRLELVAPSIYAAADITGPDLPTIARRIVESSEQLRR